MMKMQQQLADAESGKVMAQQEATRAKTQIEGVKNQLQHQKQTSELQIKGLEAQLKEAKIIADDMGKSRNDETEKYRIEIKKCIYTTNKLHKNKLSHAGFKSLKKQD